MAGRGTGSYVSGEGGARGRTIRRRLWRVSWSWSCRRACGCCRPPTGTFGAPVDAGRDEIGEQRGHGETYGNVLLADHATTVRVGTDRPIGRLTVLALADGVPMTRYRHVNASGAGAAVAEPNVVSRAGWGADESYRYNASGTETWPPAFYPVQKL